jgi:hypothetical protein
MEDSNRRRLCGRAVPGAEACIFRGILEHTFGKEDYVQNSEQKPGT